MDSNQFSHQKSLIEIFDRMFFFISELYKIKVYIFMALVNNVEIRLTQLYTLIKIIKY